MRFEHFLALDVLCHPSLRLEQIEILCHERHVASLCRCLTAGAAGGLWHIEGLRHELCVAHDMCTYWDLVAENLSIYCGCTDD